MKLHGLICCLTKSAGDFKKTIDHNTQGICWHGHCERGRRPRERGGRSVKVNQHENCKGGDRYGQAVDVRRWPFYREVLLYLNFCA